MPTAARVDPIRNFKFDVQAVTGDGDPFANMGFMSVDGIGMSTEMIAYREGGWNTSPHKFPGQTDFSPLTMSTGVYYQSGGDALWLLARKMFNVQWGDPVGLAMTNGIMTNFRYDLIVRVLGHPVTVGNESGTEGSIAGAVLAYKFVDCWTASVGFSGLNASGNEIVVQQMTVHHEGFHTYFGTVAASESLT